MEIKLAIVGSRNFNDYDILNRVVEEFLLNNDFQLISIISGGCRGTDLLAETYSIENLIDLITFKPEWDKYGRKAGIIRNHDIIKSCDVCLVFHDGVSHGTAHDINLCSTKYNKPCWVYNFVEGILYQTHD